MTKVIRGVDEWSEYRKSLPANASLGFAPTLGGLHEGHFALVRRSLAENASTVVSLFLNRVQFDNPEDCEKYPAVYEEDVAALEALGVNAVFAPRFEEMYPDDYRFKVSEGAYSKEMEGARRPGHFDGVLTVVMRLLNIVGPARAYFGEKDYQQLTLVRDMAKSFFLPVEIVACATERDENGLALSSRNRRLSPLGVKKAARLNQVMRTSFDVKAAASALRAEGFVVEYVEDRDGRRFGAVSLEGIRLIDNIELRRDQSEVFGKLETATR